MKVDFQIIHSFKPKKLQEELLSLLKETADESTTLSLEIEEKPKNIEDWSIFNRIEIKYNINSGNKNIAGFSLNIDGDFEDLVDNYAQKLQSNRCIYLVIKYGDDIMAAKYQEYYKELFDIEMELREVINFIFLDTYKEDCYNLLKDVNVTTQPVKRNSKPDEDYFKAHFENEFFFLNFGDYIEINELKDLKSPDLIEMISASKNYEDLKQKIQGRGISREKYQDFLAEIKQDLDPIEKFRNCIAHNRSIPNEDELITNYDNAKRNLKQSIDNFWLKLNE